MIKSLRQARITDGLPRVLARQEWVIALSEALGLALGKTLDYTDESQIYTRLDTAPEAVLDVLAVDWKIDWYDTELTVEQKRRIVKTALTVRRLMGIWRRPRPAPTRCWARSPSAMSWWTTATTSSATRRSTSGRSRPGRHWRTMRCRACGV